MSARIKERIKHHGDLLLSGAISRARREFTEEELATFILSELAEARREGQGSGDEFWQHLFALLNTNENKQIERDEKIMSALSDLQTAAGGLSTALTDNTNAVLSAVAHIGSPAATDAQLVPITAALTANTATLAANTKQLNDAVAAVVPPVVPPKPV